MDNKTRTIDENTIFNRELSVHGKRKMVLFNRDEFTHSTIQDRNMKKNNEQLKNADYFSDYRFKQPEPKNVVEKGPVIPEGTKYCEVMSFKKFLKIKRSNT